MLIAKTPESNPTSTIIPIGVSVGTATAVHPIPFGSFITPNAGL